MEIGAFHLLVALVWTGCSAAAASPRSAGPDGGVTASPDGALNPTDSDRLGLSSLPRDPAWPECVPAGWSFSRYRRESIGEAWQTRAELGTLSSMGEEEVPGGLRRALRILAPSLARCVHKATD